MAIRYVQALTVSADGAGASVSLDNPGTYSIQILGTFGGSTTIALQHALVNEEAAFKTAVDPYTSDPVVVTENSQVFEIKGGKFLRLLATSFAGSSNIQAIITLSDR